MEWSTATWMDQVTWAAQLAQGIGTPIALVAILFSLMTFRRQSRSEGYAKLDEMYFQLQAIGLGDPSLTKPEAFRGQAGYSDKYDLYAFMMWNFLETMHDRCGNDETLWKTWMPILQHEALVHQKWFCAAENYKRFKMGFRKFVNAGGFKRKALELRGAFSEACV